MKKTFTFAALIAVIMMIFTIRCLPIVVSAADAQEEPTVVTADIDKQAQTALTDTPSDDSPEIVRVGKSSGKSHNIFLAVIVGFGVAVVGTAIFIFVNINGYKNNGKTEPYPFTSKAPLELTVKDDVLINKEVTSRKIESNNNNN